jgi:hypothetical protein
MSRSRYIRAEQLSVAVPLVHSAPHVRLREHERLVPASATPPLALTDEKFYIRVRMALKEPGGP